MAGFLLQKELDYLQGAVDVPKRPFAAIVGGSKVHYCTLLEHHSLSIYQYSYESIYLLLSPLLGLIEDLSH